MLTGRINAFVVSIVFHVLVLIFLAKTTVVPSLSTPNKPAPLKSYIYTPPAIETQPEPESPPEELKEAETKPIEITEQATTPEAEAIASTTDPQKQAQEILANEPEAQPDEPQQASPAEQSAKSATSSANASAWQMLEALNKEKDDSFFQAQEYNRTQPNSGSLMHGEPTLVPHSVVRPTQEEIINASTQHIGGGMAITKGDNGSCTIVRDLSVVGMEGHSSTESFRCGLTKQEKAFKEHMAKFRARYGK